MHACVKEWIVVLVAFTLPTATHAPPSRSPPTPSKLGPSKIAQLHLTPAPRSSVWPFAYRQALYLYLPYYHSIVPTPISGPAGCWSVAAGRSNFRSAETRPARCGSPALSSLPCPCTRSSATCPSTRMPPAPLPLTGRRRLYTGRLLLPYQRSKREKNVSPSCLLIRR